LSAIAVRIVSLSGPTRFRAPGTTIVRTFLISIRGIDYPVSRNFSFETILSDSIAPLFLFFFSLPFLAFSSARFNHSDFSWLSFGLSGAWYRNRADRRHGFLGRSWLDEFVLFREMQNKGGTTYWSTIAILY
jgi:hypothetical protein